MKQYYIYKIICLCDEWNGKFYIGKRYGNINDNYTGSGKMIKEYFKQFGKEKDITYEKTILEIGDEFNICDLEREYIREGIKSELCLNMICVSSKGNFGHKGKKHSEETRRKISEAKKGIMSWNKGKHLSEEHRKNISEAVKKQWARN